MTRPDTVELPLVLHVSKEAQAKLAQRAADQGADLADYVSQVVEQAARGNISLEGLSGAVYQRFLDSGVSDDGLSEELEQAKHARRAENRSRRAS